MKLLLLSDVFPPGCGGSGWSAFDLASGLARRGHGVEVLVPVEGARGMRTREYEGIRIHEQGVPRFPVPAMREVWRQRVVRRLTARAAVRLGATNGVDVLHAQHRATVEAVVEAGERLSRPVVATVRDYWPECYFTDLLPRDTVCSGCTPENLRSCLEARRPAPWAPVQWVRPLVRRRMEALQQALRRASAITCISAALGNRLRAVLPERDLQIIPNFVDPAAYPYAGEAGAPASFLSVGKLTRHKGPLTLLEVVARVEAAALTVIGDGPLAAEFDAQAAARHLNVHRIPWQPRAEVWKQAGAFTAFLFTPVWAEPFGRVLLESAACGLPALVLDRGGGPAEIVHDGENGILARDLDGLVAGARALADRTFRRHLANGARRRVLEEYSADVVVPRFERLYASLV